MAVAQKYDPNAEARLKPMDLRTIQIRIVGDSPLVSHKWSEKAKKMMRDAGNGEAKVKKREPRDPQGEFESSLYTFPDGRFGFPAVAFKSAAVDACSHVSDITKVVARGAFHVIGELVVIEGDAPVMREDMVRVGISSADLRYRGEYTKWHTLLTIRYNAGVLSAEQVINLFNVAGFSLGVGENRPQCNGSWGMFHVGKVEEDEL